MYRQDHERHVAYGATPNDRYVFLLADLAIVARAALNAEQSDLAESQISYSGAGSVQHVWLRLPVITLPRTLSKSTLSDDVQKKRATKRRSVAEHQSDIQGRYPTKGGAMAFGCRQGVQAVI